MNLVARYNVFFTDHDHLPRHVNPGALELQRRELVNAVNTLAAKVEQLDNQ